MKHAHLQSILTAAIIDYCQNNDLYLAELHIQGTVCISSDGAPTLVTQLSEKVSTTNNNRWIHASRPSAQELLSEHTQPQRSVDERTQPQGSEDHQTHPHQHRPDREEVTISRYEEHGTRSPTRKHRRKSEPGHRNHPRFSSEYHRESQNYRWSVDSIPETVASKYSNISVREDLHQDDVSPDRRMQYHHGESSPALYGYKTPKEEPLDPTVGHHSKHLLSHTLGHDVSSSGRAATPQQQPSAGSESRTTAALLASRGRERERDQDVQQVAAATAVTSRHESAGSISADMWQIQREQAMSAAALAVYNYMHSPTYHHSSADPHRSAANPPASASAGHSSHQQQRQCTNSGKYMEDEEAEVCGDGGRGETGHHPHIHHQQLIQQQQQETKHQQQIGPPGSSSPSVEAAGVESPTITTTTTSSSSSASAPLTSSLSDSGNHRHHHSHHHHPQSSPSPHTSAAASTVGSRSLPSALPPPPPDSHSLLEQQQQQHVSQSGRNLRSPSYASYRPLSLPLDYAQHCSLTSPPSIKSEVEVREELHIVTRPLAPHVPSMVSPSAQAAASAMAALSSLQASIMPVGPSPATKTSPDSTAGTSLSTSSGLSQGDLERVTSPKEDLEEVPEPGTEPDPSPSPESESPVSETGTNLDISGMSASGCLQIPDAPINSHFRKMMLKSLQGKYKVLKTPEGRYKCPVCGVSYVYQPNLRKHLEKVHLGKSYKCEFCGQKFTSVQGYSFHRKVKHRDLMPYRCELCRDAFYSYTAFLQHKKRSHSNQPECVAITHSQALPKHQTTDSD